MRVRGRSDDGQVVRSTSGERPVNVQNSLLYNYLYPEFLKGFSVSLMCLSVVSPQKDLSRAFEVTLTQASFQVILSLWVSIGIMRVDKEMKLIKARR